MSVDAVSIGREGGVMREVGAGGRRGIRIGVLVPVGNPTVEPECYRLAPPGVSVHFSRLDTPGVDSVTGAVEGMEARTRAYLEAVPAAANALRRLRPAVVALAHTSVSYLAGFGADAAIAQGMTAAAGAPAFTASSAVAAALAHFDVKRLALGTPYPASLTALSRAYWQAAGFEIVGLHRLDPVPNIYDETEHSARHAARSANVDAADAVYLTGTGLHTLGALEELETELGKPVISGNQALMWRALRLAGDGRRIPGYGRLLREA